MLQGNELQPNETFQTTPVTKPSGPPDATIEANRLAPDSFNLERVGGRAFAWLDVAQGCVPSQIRFTAGMNPFKPEILKDDAGAFWIRLDFSRPVRLGTYTFTIVVEHSGGTDKVSGSIVVS